MRILLSFILLFWGAVTATAQTYPNYSEIYVNDFAGIFSDQDADRLRGTLQDLREKRGIEFTVVTLKSLSDHGYDGPIEPFATGLFNSWGVGNAARNDGLMMLVVRGDRQMRIEVGSGYGASLDGPMQRVIDHTILPEFRDGDYVNGILSGVDQVIYEVTGVYPGDYDAPRYQVLAKQGLEKAKRFWPATLAILAPIGFFLFRGVRAILRRRPRRCPNDRTWMIWLSEKDDDGYLIRGQLEEERLKSVDYDVWLCPACDNAHVIRRRNWFTSYSRCPRCDYHTLKTETTTLESPTTSSSGKARDDYTCFQCDESWSATRTLPRISKSSSSSSSGFGGGSSSGGGASGSW
ncbi:TPM domain-containing protein [Aliiroseovarius sp. KMU-50]|uniref:TPM domain-containing protein n=1 Tax=Aliiroseovarius salicola TaxID=3009082 RepID=A0ABT4VXR2_9RHOB|nr:TPM domain-containing protein [Aliiroseovarius sp. KMU-50]MDA5092974.1 TPM domain-containing protein [Aliiroseovarius sp. KMU-50]